jgi:REP element-mobilizing transposase RayT
MSDAPARVIAGLTLRMVRGEPLDEEAMARLRKKDLQQSFVFRSHGGKRKGAGRPPKGMRSSEPHKTRDEIDERHPLLATTRVVEGLGSLRRKAAYLALRKATEAVSRREDFRIVHISLQRNHLHLIVEADNKDALASGMQSFLISFAKRINRVLGRTGNVFADRYHARPLTSPRVVRNTICYVLITGASIARTARRSLRAGRSIRTRTASTSRDGES